MEFKVYNNEDGHYIWGFTYYHKAVFGSFKGSGKYSTELLELCRQSSPVHLGTNFMLFKIGLLEKHGYTFELLNPDKNGFGNALFLYKKNIVCEVRSSAAHNRTHGKRYGQIIEINQITK